MFFLSFQSDDFFKLLDTLTNQEGEISPGNANGSGDVSAAAKITSEQVVGPSTAELDSINELIHFDHIYYKPPVSVPEPMAVENSQNVAPIIVIPDEDETSVNLPSPTSSIEGNNVPMSEFSESIDFNDFDVIEELINQDLLPSDNTAEILPSDNTSKACKSGLAIIDSLGESLYMSPNFKGLTVPRTIGSLSDSGYSDMGSPRSDISSLDSSCQEEEMWEESFTELFPSLL